MSPPPPRLAASVLLLIACASACSPDPEPAGDAPRLHEALPAQRTRATPASRDSVRAPRPQIMREPTAPPPVVFDTTRPEPPVAPAVRPELPSPETLPRPPPRPPSDASPAVAGSCDVRPNEDYCFAYSGPAWTRASATSHCAAAPEATFRPGPCPTTGRIATCTFRRPSDPAREIVYTTYAPADLALARLACPGVFELVEP